MRNSKPTRSSSRTTLSFLRDRVDAYWAALDLHALILLWIPMRRGIGAARQRIDRALMAAVLAIGKATKGPDHRSRRWLDRADDALDTVLIALDDMTAGGHISCALRENAREAIILLMERLLELGGLPLDQWEATSEPRNAWVLKLTAADAVDPTSGEAPVEAAAADYAIATVVRRREAEAVAIRRATEPERVEQRDHRDPNERRDPPDHRQAAEGEVVSEPTPPV